MRIWKYILIGLSGILAGAFLIYVCGPVQEFASVDNCILQLDIEMDELPEYLVESNLSEPSLKKDNESQLFWADSIGVKTNHVLLFLHGFSGTHHEANPLHRDFGKRYGMNTYLHRIVDHGISDPDAFKILTPYDLLQSAKEGLAIAKLLGDKVVLMSCSTGGTYAAYLAQDDAVISHLIFLSPNIALYSSSASLVNGTWGESLVNRLFGDHRKVDQPEAPAAYWQTEYHTDGIIAL